MPIEFLPSLWFGKYRKLRPYVEAQAKLESGNYTNTLSVKYNNLFGMRAPSVRPSVQAGTVVLTNVDGGNHRWQVYDSHEQAVKDLTLWFDYTKFPTEVSNSLEFVTELKKRNFFEVSINQYLAGINNYLK